MLYFVGKDEALAIIARFDEIDQKVSTFTDALTLDFFAAVANQK